MEDVAGKPATTDETGRVITFRKLNALDRMRVFEVLGAALSENAAYLGYALTAASVTSVNAQPVAFPKTKTTLESAVQLLGDEGIDAVSKAYRDRFASGETGDLDTIKNSPETPPSANA